MLTEATIRSRATAQSFERGEAYYQSEAVLSLGKRGNTLLARVEGSSYEPYEVTVELKERGDIEAYCTCPYDRGGYCKHRVAALLAYMREPDQVVERRQVSELLADLRRDELLGLLTDLLSEQPHLVDWVEMKLATQASETLAAKTDQPRQRQTPIAPEPFRRQAQYAITNSYRTDDWESRGEAVGEIRDLVERARPFVEAGDGRNALLILEAVTGVFVDHWHEVDHEGMDSAMLFAELGALFAEAILSADLSPEEREGWAEKLTVWQGEIEDYGIDEGFDAAIAAAVHGWDYPPLQAVLQGHITDKGAWEEESPWYADDLALARLRVLERHGRTAEYLYLAEAEGQTALYLTMLVKLGRSQEAVSYAMQYMVTTDEAVALAQALREHNQPDEALRIAERGLGLQGETLTLARWLRDFAAQAGRPTLALKAARAAFARAYSLEDYQAAAAIAGEDWPSVKHELLELLASEDYGYGRIDIYLHEGMVDEAIHTIDGGFHWGYTTLERVVDAAWQSHPDWAIRQCKRQAEPIMDGGQSKYYHHAVRWLEKMRRAYLGTGREVEWRAYLEDLINRHARKYSLRPQLEMLRG
jgi:uncharacterized Zn finger protein